MQHFFFDPFHTNDSGHQQAGRNRRDRHHHRVRQEIKEIQELHTDDLHTRQRTISKRRKASKSEHDHCRSMTVAFFRLQLSSSSKVDTALSVSAMELVIAANSTSTKNRIPTRVPKSHARQTPSEW